MFQVGQQDGPVPDKFLVADHTVVVAVHQTEEVLEIVVVQLVVTVHVIDIVQGVGDGVEGGGVEVDVVRVLVTADTAVAVLVVVQKTSIEFRSVDVSVEVSVKVQEQRGGGKVVRFEVNLGQGQGWQESKAEVEIRHDAACLTGLLPSSRSFAPHVSTGRSASTYSGISKQALKILLLRASCCCVMPVDLDYTITSAFRVLCRTHFFVCGPASDCKMTSLLYAIVLLLPGVTYGINLKPYNLTAAALFLNIDLDVSGDIDRPELDLNFRTYDANNNGRVSRQEYTNYVNGHTPSLVPLHDAFYDIYDVDGDHQLDHHDFDNFFSLMDSNSDGIVAYFEFVRYWTILLETLEHLIVRNAAVKVTEQPTFQPTQQPLTTQKPLATQQPQLPLTTQKPPATQQPLTTQKPNA